MAGRVEWVLLAYRVPREPSSPRIAIWRRLRRLGVAQIVDGLVALPADARTVEHLEWVADEVTDTGGEASLWVGRLQSTAQERHVIRRMAEGVAAEYQAVIDEVEAGEDLTVSARRRVVARLRRELHRIEQRDYFPPPERARAKRAVNGLAAALEPV
ncbi:MAG TPA: Chromate resistance protein ChrB [Acidimicrobiales bacterium]|jgi:hypothetical protein|nr:Chromate resistance protein ChrB [Acidimicrobiales bacterium]